MIDYVWDTTMRKAVEGEKAKKQNSEHLKYVETTPPDRSVDCCGDVHVPTVCCVTRELTGSGFWLPLLLFTSKLGVSG